MLIDLHLLDVKQRKVSKIRNINLLFLVHPPKTVEIETRTVELEEKGVKLRLTVVDTPGFGDGLNSTEWFIYFSFNL